MKLRETNQILIIYQNGDSEVINFSSTSAKHLYLEAIEPKIKSLLIHSVFNKLAVTEK
jgi:hypothetical protein